MSVGNAAFFLKFVLTSYSAVFFFAAGLGFALSYANNLRPTDLIVLFCVIAVVLSFSFRSETPQGRFLIAVIWTSLLWAGYRFGRKIKKS
jgi:hypothetical protein